MKTKIWIVSVIFAVAALWTTRLCADPQLTSWLTTYSGKYARIYATDADKTSGNAVTTWSRNSLSQSSPVYCGVREIYSSANWIYIRSSGLASHTMGPWYLNANHAMLFPNLPINTKVFYRIPRTPTTNATHALTGLGPIGYFVDGVAMFDSRDAFYWNPSTSSEPNGTGSWNRDAYVNESVTFDSGNAHQPGSGQYHYHANPPALRYLLGDHVDFNPTTKTYSENTNAPAKHSPVLGWARDGFPVYGPYGYSNALDSASGVRRMISGFVPRNGQNGTDNISTIGAMRSTIPAWAQRAYTQGATQSGPAISSTYPFGRYLEDNAYLGDLTNSVTGQVYQQGAEFDLNEWNCRWCVTPEFPSGTWAYFTSISSNGTPTFPYNIGRAFFGSPTGNTVSSLAESVTTNFVGGANAELNLATPVVSNNIVTLTWSATEGGTYRVEESNNLTAWTTNASGIAAVLNKGTVNTPAATNQSFRVIRTALAPYDTK